MTAWIRVGSRFAPRAAPAPWLAPRTAGRTLARAVARALGRAVALALGASLLVGATACTNGPETIPEGPMATVIREAQAEAALVRASAQQLGRLFSEEAGRLEAARAKPDEPAARASLDRLEDGHLALEALEESQGSLGVAVRYAEIRGRLELPEADQTRLDQGAQHLVEVARNLHRHALEMLAGSQRGEAARRDGAKTEVERDRAALKAWRADLGIAARLGG